MKAQIFIHDCTHYGLCGHHSKVDPDELVLVESSFFSGDAIHAGIWIGRFAEAPWDSLVAYSLETQLGFTWHIIKPMLRN